MYGDLTKAKSRTTKGKGSASARNALGKLMNDKISNDKTSAAEKVLSKSKGDVKPVKWTKAMSASLRK